MFKTKLKLNLIDDYIKIYQIANFYTYYNQKIQFDGFLVLTANILKITKELKSKYEQIFLKLGLLDESFYVLKQQILCTSGWLFADNQETEASFAAKTKENLQIIKNIELKLPKVLKKLSFNDFEINYIAKFSD